MSPRVRVGLIVLGLIGFLASLLLVYAHHAMQQVQPFYVAAIEVDPVLLEGASQEMESRVAELYSEPVQESRWQAVFSDTEVNGWLAVALAEKYADLLPESIVDPRVAFEEGELLVGFKYAGDSFDSVISLRASVDVEESDVVTVRLIEAHAGTLLLPMAKVVETLKQAASDHDLPLQWSENSCDPMASIALREVFTNAEEKRLLEAIEIRDGEVELAGSTEKPTAVLAEQPTLTTLR